MLDLDNPSSKYDIIAFDFTTNIEKSNLLKCQHVSLEVSNVDKSLEFYRNFLHMKLTERHKAGEHKAIPFEMAFLRLNEQHHDLVLTHNPNRNYTKKNDQNSPAGIHHFAFADKPMIFLHI